MTTDLVKALLDGIMAVGMLAMLFVYGGWLGFIVLITAALDAAFRVVAFRSYNEYTGASIACEAKQQTHFIETLRGIASVKLLSLGNRRQATWLNHLVDTLNARLRLHRLDLVFSQANELLFGADRLVLMALGAYAVINGQMTLGMLVAFLAYKDQFAIRIGGLISTTFQIRVLNVQSERLSDIVMAEPEPRECTWPVAPCDQYGKTRASALRAEGLSLRYGDADPWIFKNFSLQIPAEQCVAITGPSGCGKSSLLKVLMGLLSPTEGSIYVDGAKITANTVANYRAYIAGVMQDDGLFAGSIAENICSFDDNPDNVMIQECAVRAAILDEIRQMPMGFETLVGDMGSALSGGQKQRIVLARALYRRPAILFLDEATSHIDQATEAVIVAGLRELRMTGVIVCIS